jgi:hypothetical protein
MAQGDHQQITAVTASQVSAELREAKNRTPATMMAR